MEYSNFDKLRALYDFNTNCEATGSVSSFQSSLFQCCFSNEVDNSSALNDVLCEILQSLPPEPETKISLAGVDEEAVFACLESCFDSNPSEVGYLNNHYSIKDGIDFCNDLLVASRLQDNNALGHSIDINSTERSPNRFEYSERAAKQPKLDRKPVQISDSPEEPTVAITKKSNPFKSAKDQLIQEGGSLPKNTVANKVTQNSSAKGLEKRMEHSSTTGIEKNILERIEAEILHTGAAIKFEDIAGLSFAKKCVNELICWPMMRPDLFQGLRSLPKGLLLFGPPGTGKTLIGKAIAHEAGATFFNISSSSLTSKWIGEGEKTVRALFAVATEREPSIIFVDEVDSLLCQRSSEENEGSRRLKTEFLVQLDGAGTSETARVVIVGATNRPEELDEAARRRFVKRIYIPLPDDDGRRQLLRGLLSKAQHSLSASEIESLVRRSEGFSGADIRALCTEAAMCPMRELAGRYGNQLKQVRNCDVPDISSSHFTAAFDAVAPSVSPSDLQRYVDWNSTFGSFRNNAAI